VQSETSSTDVNPSAAVLLNENSELEQINHDAAASDSAFSEDDFDDSYVGEPSRALNQDHYDERPMTLSEKAKLAVGRENVRDSARETNSTPRNGLKSIAAAGVAATSASAAANRAFSRQS